MSCAGEFGLGSPTVFPTSASSLLYTATFVRQVTVVMKFGGSSVRDAERMREVANIVCSFPNELPAVVLSAMGKTTNNLLQSGKLEGLADGT